LEVVQSFILCEPYTLSTTQVVVIAVILQAEAK
jgi:hypothetical protein